MINLRATSLPITKKIAPHRLNLKVESAIGALLFITTVVFSGLGTLAKLPYINNSVAYVAIFFGILPTTLVCIFFAKQLKIKKIDLAFFVVLIFYTTLSIMYNNNIIDVIADFYRFLFLFICLVLFNSIEANYDILLYNIYKYLLYSVIVVVSLYILLYILHLPVKTVHFILILPLLSYFCYKDRWISVFILCVVAAFFSKGALFLGYAAIIFTSILINKNLKTKIYMMIITLFLFFCLFIFSASNWTIFVHFLGSSDLPLVELSRQLLTGNLNESLLNTVSSNRWSEYQSIFNDWSENGVPYTGRGLGSVVNVQLAWSGEVVERSTIHNSYLALFHKLGLISIIFIYLYFLAPTIRYWNDGFFGPLAVGILIYCFFSFSIVQAPTVILIFAAMNRITLTRLSVALPERDGARKIWNGLNK